MQLFELFGVVKLDDQASKGLDEIDGKAEKSGSKFGKFAKGVGVGAVAIGAAAVAAGVGMYKMATSSAETTDRIDKLSQKIGLSRTGFQEWDFIMSQSGGSVEGLQMGFKTMVNSIDQAVAGSGKGADSFKKLGVSVKEANGNVKDQETIFNESVIALQNMEDGTEKAKLANDLFGRSGAEMMPLLNGAAGSVEEMKKQAHDLGLVMSDESIDAGVAFTDTMDQLQRSFKTAVAEIGVQFMPVITKFADFITANMPAIQAFISNAFGVASTVIGTAVNWISVIIDAFQKFFNKARDSLGGVEGLFEKLSPVLDNLKGAFQKFMDSVGPIWESLKTLFESLEPILIMIGAIVGGILVTAFGLAISIFTATVAAIGPLINAVINIVDIVVNMVNVVVALLTGDFAGAWEYLGDIAESTKELFFNIFDGIVTFISTFVTTIIDFFHGLYMTLVGNSIIPDMVNAIVDWFKNLGKWAIDLVKKMVTNVVKWFINLYTDAVSNFNKLKSSATTIFNAVKNAIMKPILSAKDNAIKFIVSLFTSARDNFNKLRSSATTIFNNVKNVITKPIETAKTNVIKFATSLFTGARDKFNDLKTSATTIFNNVKDAIVNPIEKARDLIGAAIDKVKGFFSGLSLKFPKIKMPKLPKFSMEGKFGLAPPSVPKLKLNWNAMGGIANGPTIANTSRGLQGFGEVAGESEAFLPLNDQVLGAIGKGIADTMGGTNDNQPIVVEVHVTSVIDGEVAARSLEPAVTVIQDRKVKVRESFAT